ncbi:excisionase [Salmonella enterica]|nr:excisionase [Salmonella enterica]
MLKFEVPLFTRLNQNPHTGLKPGTITRARKESWMLGREYLHISPDGNPKPSSECIYNREAVDQWIEAQKKNQPGAKTT